MDETTDDIVKETVDLFVQRAYRKDMWVIYISIIIINILFLVTAISGINTNWYKNLKKSNASPILIGILWIIATVLSYGAIYMLWENLDQNKYSKDITISLYFLIGSLLALLWISIFLQDYNLRMGFWISFILFCYQLWVTIVVFIYNKKAFIFLIPNIIMYLYLFYTMAHLVTINDVLL